MNYNQIEHIKPLNNSQYEACRKRAVQLTKNRIGEKPDRKQFKREYRRLWNILDVLVVIVFFSALLMSSSHILAYGGSEASRTYEQVMANVLGSQIGETLYGYLHQWPLLALSEASMILFAVLAKTRRGFERGISAILAIVAGFFVVHANLESNLNILPALIPSIFTIGTSFRIEYIISKYIERDEVVDKQYSDALNQWQEINNSPETSSLFQQIFASELWSKIVSLKANEKYVDADVETKRLVVLREMERENWLHNLEMPVSNFPTMRTIQNNQNGHKNKVILFGE